MAHELGTTVDKVATAGTGLAFEVYPDAVTRMPGNIPQLWSVLFFLMLITLGLDSQFTILEAVTTSLMDRWPKLFDRKWKTLIILGCCVIFFAIGLLLCTNAGGYILELMDAYCGGWGVLFIGLFECFAVAWVYGWYRWSHDIGLMLGSRPNFLWRIMWTALTPMVITFVLLFAWVDYSPLMYGAYEFPVWANGIGWAITVCIVIPTPIIMVILFLRADGGFCDRWRAISEPTREWGPALVKHRQLVRHIRDFMVDPSKTHVPRNLNSSPYAMNDGGEETYNRHSGRDDTYNNRHSGHGNPVFHNDGGLM